VVRRAVAIVIVQFSGQLATRLLFEAVDLRLDERVEVGSADPSEDGA
jgi:hypothetical protein